MCFLSHKIIQRLISVQRFGADELEEVCNLVKITKHKVAPLIVGRKGKIAKVLGIKQIIPLPWCIQSHYEPFTRAEVQLIFCCVFIYESVLVHHYNCFLNSLSRYGNTEYVN